MRKTMRSGIMVLMLLCCCSVTTVSAEVSIGIGLPNVSIGINLPLYPELVPVPGYPVYYAPRLEANYFFYDGMYWVYLDDYWYASYWYNGPWWIVERDVVPLFILRIPVRYYRYPPPYFRGWRPDAPPRWGQHWGHDWEHQHRGWDKWKRGSAPARAPLPAYQRQYTGDRYPRQMEQQQALRSQHYRYQPRDKAVRQHFQAPSREHVPAPVQRGRQEERARIQGTQEHPRPEALPQREHRPEPQRPAPVPQRGPAYREQREQPGGMQYERQAPRSYAPEQRYEERGQEPRGRGHEQRRDDDRGREHGR